VAASCCMCHTIWLRNLLCQLNLQQLEATEIRVDNKSVIELAKNSVHHERSKHIVAHFHFIREHLKNGEVRLTHVATHDQVAYIFIKPLPTVLFENLKEMIGMKYREGLSLRRNLLSIKPK